MPRNIALGVKARDVVTGFTGIVTGKATYLTGCDQFCLTTQVDDKHESKGNWFDENRIEILDGAPVELYSGEPGAPIAGGPQAHEAPRY